MQQGASKMREKTGGKLCSYCGKIRAEHVLYCSTCNRVEYACDLCYSDMDNDEHSPDISYISDSDLEELR